MFQLRNETDYAIQFLRLLAKSKKNLSLTEVANQTGISFLFLQKIARKLRLAGLIKAEQGVNGGYKLAKSPKSLSLKDVVKAVEGRCGMVDCSCGSGCSCDKTDKCQVKSTMAKVDKQVNGILEKVKLSQL